MNINQTPMPLVRFWESKIPGVWRTLDGLLAVKQEAPWPDYCYIPISAADSLLVEMGMPRVESAKVSAELTACYIWQKYKTVFNFDPDLARTLAAQADDIEPEDHLPSDLLLRLPYPVIYVRCPGVIQTTTEGFWAWVEYDMNTKMTEFRVQFVARTRDVSFPMTMHLLPGKSIIECMDSTIATSIANMKENSLPTDGVEALTDTLKMQLSRPILQAIQMVLYLISTDPDVEDEPRHPTPKKAKRKPGASHKSKTRPEKPTDVKGKNVGVRVGHFLRTAARNSAPAPRPTPTAAGSSKRPHSRRGHWHHYWTGKKDSADRKLILKWTAPTFIHSDDGSVVVYDIKNT